MKEKLDFIKGCCAELAQGPEAETLRGRKIFILSDIKAGDGEIEILNALGKVILKSNIFNQNQPIDVSVLSSGMYSVRVTSPKDNETFKLIINR